MVTLSFTSYVFLHINLLISYEPLYTSINFSVPLFFLNLPSLRSSPRFCPPLKNNLFCSAIALVNRPQNTCPSSFPEFPRFWSDGLAGKYVSQHVKLVRRLIGVANPAHILESHVRVLFKTWPIYPNVRAKVFKLKNDIIISQRFRLKRQYWVKFGVSSEHAPHRITSVLTDASHNTSFFNR